MRRPNKFNAVKTVVDGITFDSKAEARRYGELKLLEKSEKIRWLCVHPKYQLKINDILVATYKADFEYWTGHNEHPICNIRTVEDVKSPPTAKKRDFILIRKLMKAIHGIDVEVIQ